MIKSSDKEGVKRLLEDTQYKRKNDVFNSSEYREMYDGEKLYMKAVKYHFINLGLKLMSLRGPMTNQSFGREANWPMMTRR